MLNYSIIENSLNIKLECLRKQSLEYKDLISNTLKEQKTTQVDKKQSIAKLHALLENQNLECIHGGKVILKSNKGKTFKDDGVPIMLESDLLNSSIVACPHTIANVSYPCTKVVDIKGSLSQKKVNNEYVILQELISACKTDKGFALKVSFTPTKFKFDHSFDPKEGLGEQSKNQIELKEPIIRLHYKSDRFQKDNLPIYNLLINNEKKEQNKALNEFNIDLKDLKDIEDINILNQFKQDFSKDYEFKELNLSFDTNLIKLYFIIPKNIAKVYKSAYKEFENKDLGVGYFTQLHEYDKDYRENENIIHHRVFLAPAKMQKIGFEIAKGLDEWLDNENVCCFNVYTKDYFNANDKDMLISDNIKDDTNTTQAHTNENYNNTQEIIPDNVIRIQTQDGSGEFIEIIFDEFKEWEKSSSGAIKPLFTPLEGIVEDISNSLENVSIIGDALAMLGAVKNPKNAKNIIKKKSKYATKQEVIEVLKNKYNLKTSKELGLGRSKNVFWVKDNKQIKEIWEEITDGADILKDINQDKLGGTIKMRKLDDQTIIQYKKASKSGGETIEVNSNKPRGNLRTIHIENGVKNEV
ncbi:hypothetical protein KBI89_02250 [Campylobacter coli]|uniref:hypothetical protein n=1 Tax=Campylobacter coli TaxID=195 RepID=UPI00126C27CC|nr:hypothetical protein [Campylobacter coli]EAK0312677.1 hypothetical protein [Campylobacter coli]EAK7357322.1 hypothetical protein [Campylobacter coli]MCC2571546.1 hypothetical protein [Campylobacter coli]MCC2575732.1 hypothetical protein [Campylobacter coli]MCG4070302.1 hypothetical protein [Campylobacter coli]